MQQIVCSQCRKKLRVSWATGNPECAHCGQWLGDPSSRLQIEVDEAAAAMAEQREQQVAQRNEVTVRHAAFGALLGANLGALLVLLSQGGLSKPMIWGVAIGAVLGVAYWLLADLFEPTAGDIAGGTQVGGVRVVTEFHMAAMPFVMGAMLRTLFGNLHAGLMFPLLGTLVGILTAAQFLGGIIALFCLVAAVSGGLIAGLCTHLLFNDPKTENVGVDSDPPEQMPDK